MVGEFVDNLVGVFSPTSKLQRMAAREAINSIGKRTQYAAAKNTLNTGEWSPVDSQINTLLVNSLPMLRTRARQLVRDMPAMSTGLDRAVDFTIGTGITLKPLIKDADGKLDKKLNQKVEDVFSWWCDEADEGGNVHFSEMQQLCCRQDIEVGEFLAIKKYSKKRNRYLPFSLLQLEPDVLSRFGGKTLHGNVNGNLRRGNDIFQGVEYDPKNASVSAYHFEDHTKWKKTLRIPSDRVIIGYKTLRPGQLRGVTCLAPVVILAGSLRDFIEAEVSTAQKAARWLAFVNSDSPAQSMQAFGAAASPTYKDTADNAKYTMEMGHAIVDFLHSGEKVTIASHNRPGDAFYPFVKHILQTFAAQIGISYEIISGNYMDAKYTAARVSRNDMGSILGIRRARIIRQLNENVRREVMDWAVLTGKLDIPDYFRNPIPYQRHVWLDDGQQPIDPLREGRAEKDAVEAKLRSPQEGIVSRGRDPIQVLDEIEAWKEELKARGLTEKDVSTALQTNPANVGAGEA